MNKEYRLDIQFLRAIAVLSVVLYHFQFTFIKGGFVGVDIFFVISGYLISKSIFKQLDNNNFNFMIFCFNRLKRLYPALLVTILAIYITGYVYLSPIDFENLSASTIYASTGLSNIYFWLTSGYFDSFASLKPLLHTWSLSVEFQFYLLWPLILIIISIKSKYKILFLCILTILSGIISYRYLKYDATGAFFLMPFRIHEFSIGALVCLLETKRSIKKDKYNNIIYLLGLGLTLYSIFFFNSNKISFPGTAVWIPVVGTALMIYTGAFVTFYKILQNKTTSFIGEISYSMYLVHWPIFVFYVYLNLDDITFLDKMYLIGMTSIATLGLYFLVEKPFRQNKNNISNLSYSFYCQSISFIVVLFAITSFIGKGWDWRLPKELRLINHINMSEMNQFTWEKQEKYAIKHDFSDSKKKKILVIGDSQAADIINLLTTNTQNYEFDIVARTIITDCAIPFIDPIYESEYYNSVNTLTISDPDKIPLCKNLMKNLLDNHKLFEQADMIFIAFNWHDFILPYMDSALDKLNNLTEGNKKIFLFGDKSLKQGSIAIVNSLPTKVIASSEDINTYAYRFKKDNNRQIDKFLKNRTKEIYIDMNSIICPINRCIAVTDNKEITFFDGYHLTPKGAQFLGDKLFDRIEKYL